MQNKYYYLSIIIFIGAALVRISYIARLFFGDAATRNAVLSLSADNVIMELVSAIVLTILAIGLLKNIRIAYIVALVLLILVSVALLFALLVSNEKVSLLINLLIAITALSSLYFSKDIFLKRH